MSKIALKPNDSGTGTFTLESPNSNTDRVLTLPDSSGSLMSSLDQTILQKKWNGYSVETVYTGISSGWTPTLFEVSITPKLSSTRIIVECNAVFNMRAINGAGDCPVYYRLNRNGSPIAYFFSGSGAGNGGTSFAGSSGFTYLDNPATTSAVSYTVEMAGRNDGNYWELTINTDQVHQSYRALTPTMSTIFATEVRP